MRFPVRSSETKCKVVVLYLIYIALLFVLGALSKWNVILVSIYGALGLFLLYATIVLGKTFMHLILGQQKFMLEWLFIRFRYDYARVSEIDVLEDRRGRIISIRYRDPKGKEKLVNLDYDKMLYMLLSDRIKRSAENPSQEEKAPEEKERS